MATFIAHLNIETPRTSTMEVESLITSALEIGLDPDEEDKTKIDVTSIERVD